MILWLRGYPDQALDRCREAVALAERVSHPVTHGAGAVELQLTSISCGANPTRVADGRTNGSRWQRNSSCRSSISEGRFQLGWALAEEGHVEEGIREMREGIAAITATGAEAGYAILSLCPRAGLRRVW